MTRQLLQTKPLLKLSFFAALSVLLISCEAVGYYTQAARGQLHILASRQSIQSLLNDPELDADLRSRLELAVEIKEFAIDQLQLPQSKNFDSYADLNKEHVVWNVFAAPEFETSPVNWCYPIAGCVAYRGYFEQSKADSYAEKLSVDGFDVYTGGVDAYSTLGWFDDPLLSTVINRADYQLAGLIFHELAHQVVYLEGDTTFNESFATTVEREGVERWLQYKGSQDSIALATKSIERQQQFVELIAQYQEKFAELYESEIASSQMRIQKAQLQDQLRKSYAQLKAEWGGYEGYDGWFANSLNNAQLSTVSSYNDFVSFFQQQLVNQEGDLSAFYEKVIELSELDIQAREEQLRF